MDDFLEQHDGSCLLTPGILEPMKDIALTLDWVDRRVIHVQYNFHCPDSRDLGIWILMR